MNAPSPASVALQLAIVNEVRELFEKYGIEGWDIRFDREFKRAGFCNHSERYLSFSMIFAHAVTPEERTNTLLHEVAHILSGPYAGHNKFWRARFIAMGGNGKTQTDTPATVAKAQPWVGTCPTCSYKIGMSRSPGNVWLCGACPKSLSSQARLFSWEKNGVAVAPEAVGKKFSEQYARISAEWAKKAALSA